MDWTTSWAGHGPNFVSQKSGHPVADKWFSVFFDDFLAFGFAKMLLLFLKKNIAFYQNASSFISEMLEKNHRKSAIVTLVPLVK
jgi:hypothetical protein